MARTMEQTIDELRYENEALKTLMRAMREKKRVTAAMVELTTTKGKASWIVTCPWPTLEREIGEAIGMHIAKEIGQAVRLTTLFFTGTSIAEQGTDELSAEEVQRLNDGAREPTA